MKKTRYRLKLNGELIAETSSIDAIAKSIGCTKAHIHQRLVDGKFTYKKIIYEIEDKLDLI